MQHSKSEVFQRHYLPRYINVDTQAAYRGTAPQSAVMRAASGMRRSIDPRRPRKLTAEQLASVEMDPRVAELHSKRDQVIQGLAKAKRMRTSQRALLNLQSARRNATLAYRREKRRRKQALLEKTKKDFDRHQAIADIQDQLHGQSIDIPARASDASLPPQRARVFQTLFTLPEPTSKKEVHRITRAIAALVPLSGARENHSSFSEVLGRTLEKAQRQPGQTNRSMMPTRVPASAEVDSRPQHRQLQCFICFGDDTLSTQKRLKEFYSRRVLEKHLRRHHLRHISERSILICPIDGRKLCGHSRLISHWKAFH